MYADYSSVHTCAKTIETLNHKLNNDMINLTEWCKDNNNMVVNYKKTKAMLIITYLQATKLETDELHIRDGGIELQHIITETLLDIKVGCHLSWKDQIDKVTATLISGIGLLRRIKDYLIAETRITQPFCNHIRILYYYYITDMYPKCHTGHGTRSVTRQDLTLTNSSLCVTRKSLAYSGAFQYNTSASHN